jgi:hypothetical protein
MIIIYLLLALPSIYSCHISICNNTLTTGCSFFSQAISLLPYSISQSCEYISTKYICTASKIQNDQQPFFPWQDCDRLRYCFTDPNIILPLCSTNSTLTNNTLIYDFPYMIEPFCPSLDTFAKSIDVKYLLGESYYYVNLSTLNTIDINPLSCKYDSLQFNNKRGQGIFIGFAFFLFFIILLSIVYIILRSKTPIKQRGIFLQLINNFFLTLSLWSFLEIHIFGFSAHCLLILLFANFFVPLLGIINLVKAFQLYFVYSWQIWRLNNKGNIPLNSLVFRCRRALTEKGALLLLFVFSLPVIIILSFILVTYRQDIQGSISQSISCKGWSLPSLNTITPYNSIVPNLSSCKFCSFFNDSCYAILTLVVLCIINFILIIVLCNIRKMRDDYYIWIELFSITFFNVTIYTIFAISYDFFLDYNNITPSALISSLIIFNVIISTIMPIFQTLKNINKVVPVKIQHTTESITVITYTNSDESKGKDNRWIKEDIKEKLKNDDFYNNVRDHCQRRFEANYFHCLNSLIEQSNQNNIVQRYYLGKKIYETYIKENSPLFIDILSPFDKSISKYYKNIETYKEYKDIWEYNKVFDVLSNYIIKSL